MKTNRKWGGVWTDQKLQAFENYVNAYLTIMNKYRDKYGWKLIYFDAFAGSGTRETEQRESGDSLSLTDLNIDPTEVILYKGAAERILSIEKRGFDFYYFIDKDNIELDELEKKLTKENFHKDKKIIYRPADANREIIKLAEAMCNDKQYKTLAFLDPFGMQVEWTSIEKLKDTNTDLWILIPTGNIVNRLLDKKGELTHIAKLESFFGLFENEIREYFYKEKIENTLFGEIPLMEKIQNPIKQIANLYIKRLKMIFSDVTEEPLEMKNSRNVPIFHFAFASNNKTAKKIASQIIGKI